MTRRPDWPERMAAAVEAARGRPFRWGRHDCALFACDVVLAMTGIDLADGFRGGYSTRRAAREAIRRLSCDGVRSLAESVAKVRGIARIGPALAHRGDVALVRVGHGPPGEALGVCAGKDVLVASLRGGLTAVPLSSALAAWRI